jgi:transglutaminase-like putative cysteine protease
MPIRAYSQREIRTGRARLEKPLLLAVLLAQAMFSYADANWLLLAVSIAAIGGSWLAAHRHREIYVSRTVLNLGVILVGVALVARYITVEQELLAALGNYVMLIQICKLFERKGNRDYIQMIIMSLLLVLASAMICQELLFAILFLAYIVCMCKAAMAFTIKRSLDVAERPAGAQAAAEPWPARAVTARLAVVVAAILATGATVFLIVPRGLAGGTGPMAGLSRQAASGFADAVRLGQQRSIYLSDRVVMQMRMVSPATGLALGAIQTPYLRGRCYNQYYDSRWSKAGREQMKVMETDEPLLARCARQEISMVPSLLPVAFASYPALLVTSHDATVSRKDDLEYELRVARPLDRLVRYTAMVLPGELSTGDLSAVEGLSAGSLSWRGPAEMPPDVPAKVVELARQWCGDLLERRKGANGEQFDRLNLEIAGRVSERLSAGYDYTLDLTGADPTRDGVEDFLFHLKAGHCEYFASAMTVMCQALGVRARLATGFAGGEYDGESRSYTIRQRDAHAWTEVYTPLTGWKVFDATPAARFTQPPTTAAGKLWVWARDTWRNWEFAWFSHVVGYDDTDRDALVIYTQQRLAGLAGLARRAAMDIWRAMIELFAKGRIDPALTWFFIVLAATALLAAALLHLRHIRRPRRPRPARLPAAPRPPAFITQLLKLLARRNLRPAPSQTAREWADQAIARLNLPAGEVHSLIDLYDRVRWSGQTPARDELAQAEMRVRHLRDFLST